MSFGRNVPMGGPSWGIRPVANVVPGQVRRFKNANFDLRYVVLSYSKTWPEKCHVMMLDEHEKGDGSIGDIFEYDHDTVLFAMSTEYEP